MLKHSASKGIQLSHCQRLLHSFWKEAALSAYDHTCASSAGVEAWLKRGLPAAEERRESGARGEQEDCTALLHEDDAPTGWHVWRCALQAFVNLPPGQA
jgi:hypothetical protein